MGPKKTLNSQGNSDKKDKAAVSHFLIQIILSYSNQDSITFAEKDWQVNGIVFRARK